LAKVRAPDELTIREKREPRICALGAGTARLVAAEGPDRLVLHVTDQGEGFPPDFLERAFDRCRRRLDTRLRERDGDGK
jgi:signal transduction histidine kinase